MHKVVIAGKRVYDAVNGLAEHTEDEGGYGFRDVAEILTAVLLFISALGFLNYALINMNTGYPWMPFVAGPIVSTAFMIALIPLVFTRTYRLFLLEIIAFIITTAIAYTLTYSNSTIYGYENASLPFILIMSLIMYLHWYEGDEYFSSTIVYTLHMLLVALTFLVVVLLSFRWGSSYDLTELTLLLLLALSLFAVIVAFTTERKMPTLLTATFSFILWLFSLIPIKFVYPDVTLWFAMAPVLCMLLSSIYIPIVERWE